MAKRRLFSLTEATYIGGWPVEGRRPLSEHEWRNAEPRLLTWSLRVHNAVVLQLVPLFYRAGRPPRRGPIPRIDTYAAEYELWEIAESANTLVGDRDLAAIEASAQKQRGGSHEERNGWLATIEVQFGEDGGARRYLRAADWGNVMRRGGVEFRRA